MPPIYKGASGTTSIEYAYHPDRGWYERYHERGTPAWIDGRVAGWEISGFDVSVNRGGPYSDLFASKVSAGASVSYIERWSVTSEILEKSIWSRPIVIAESIAWALENGYVPEYKKRIEDAASDGEPLDSVLFGLYPVAQKVHRELSRGVESYETEYAILTKELSVPASSLLNIQLATTRTIYTSAQLQSVENIPSNVMFSLPDAPSAAEPQTMWGWRVRDQEAEVAVDTRVVLRSTWAFAQWSTFLYTPAV